eukprot:6766701-Alexandrium_andersonii.AAC.1
MDLPLLEALGSPPWGGWSPRPPPRGGARRAPCSAPGCALRVPSPRCVPPGSFGKCVTLVTPRGLSLGGS